MPKTTRLLTPNASGLQHACRLLQEGKLVSFPTETVYGLGADAFNDAAIAAIYAAKGRPAFNPLIAHVASLDSAQTLCHFNDTALKLAATFWPGALTLVLPLKEDSQISKLVSAGLKTLAVRVPNHPLALELLTRFNGAIAAPSANPSGRISATSSTHVMQGLGGLIDGVLDGGSSNIGVESTIISCVGPLQILRAGGISSEQLETCLKRPVPSIDDKALSSQNLPSSPGQLTSHYAPNGTLRLNALGAQQGEVLLGFGAVDAAINLSITGDLQEAAANLFSALHHLDDMNATHIAVSPIPDQGLGAAINDRLKRAAAPKET